MKKGSNNDMLRKRPASYCRGCGKHRDRVPRLRRKTNLCEACHVFFTKHGHFDRKQPHRSYPMTRLELRAWLLDQCETQGTHLLYQGDRKDIGVEGKKMLLARARWYLEYGKEPENWVLHRPECEKDLGTEHWRCIALDHLYLGTHRENMNDKKLSGNAKGKTAGENSTSAKLMDEDVRKIRRMYATGDYRQTELARRFGVNQSQISLCVTRKTRGHVQ